ncbi:MAG: FAD:protein FMN transferase [Ruminococcaceae bacterium]|nr:FAD:protein FMN transferase [Oscillospiraceae bacterium]
MCDIMKKFKLLIVASLVLISMLCTLWGCNTNTNPQKAQAEIYALDTIIEITAYGEKAQEAITAAKAEIYALEKLFSVTDTDSDTHRINTAQGNPVKVSDEVYTIIEKSLEYNTLTKGNFDITLYNVTKLWGFTTDSQRVPEDYEITEALKNTGSHKVTLYGNNEISVSEGTALDLGAVAKGYIGDRVAEVLSDSGAEYGIISLGGNIRTFGEKADGSKWRTGIRHPHENGYFIIADTGEVSVITSGAYQRNFTVDGKTYHHIINPETGYPSESDAQSVTIIGTDGALCDALSTAVFIGGTEYADKLYKELQNFEYIILSKDNTVYASQGLKGSLELSHNYKDMEIIYR